VAAALVISQTRLWLDDDDWPGVLLNALVRDATGAVLWPPGLLGDLATSDGSPLPMSLTHTGAFYVAAAALVLRSLPRVADSEAGV
jgi:hypothetical protein